MSSFYSSLSFYYFFENVPFLFLLSLLLSLSLNLFTFHIDPFLDDRDGFHVDIDTLVFYFYVPSFPPTIAPRSCS